MPKYLSIILLLLTVIETHAQEKLSLENAIIETLGKNFSIVIARKNEQIAVNNNDLGNAGFLPTANVEGTYTRSQTDTEQQFFDGREFNVPGARSEVFNTNARLDWVLFDGFRMFAAKERLGYLEELGKTQTQIVMENVLVELISTYYQLITQQELLQVYKDALEVSQSRRDLIQKRFELGAGNRIELLQTMVNVNADSSQYMIQQNNVRRLRTLVNQFMNRDIKTHFEASDEINLNKNLIYEELLELALVQNRAMSEARLNLKVNEATINETKSRYWPQLNFFAGLSYNQLENEAGFIQTSRNQGFNYGLNMRLNLFNGFNDRREIQNQKILKESSENMVKDIQLRLTTNVYNAYNDYQTAITIAEFEEKNLQIANQNLDIAMEQFNLAVINEVTFREIQQNAVEVANRLLQARFDVKLTELELMQLSGGLIRNAGY